MKIHVMHASNWSSFLYVLKGYRESRWSAFHPFLDLPGAARLGDKGFLASLIPRAGFWE